MMSLIKINKDQKKILVDADSLCYASAFKKSLKECYLSILERVREITVACQSTDIEFWIEDWIEKDIFRNQVAVTKPYKGNRKGSDRPEFLVEAKEYLVEHFNTKVTQKYESEDMCLVRATELGRDKCVIAFIDKDLLQAPFDYYNYLKKKHISLTPKQAEINLYRQIITGDITDNIPGIFRMGPKKAEKLIDEKTVNIPLAVATAYKEKGLTYDYLIEQSRLIYLIRDIEEATSYSYPITQEEFNQIEIKKAK